MIVKEPFRNGEERDLVFSDAADNREALRSNGKLTMPVLAIGGAISTSGSLMEEMMKEVVNTVTGLRVPGTGHWVIEENPVAVATALLEFLRSPATPRRAA
jgi:pimeloyl-ACP methyl ester carboxylesterase